MPSQSHCVYNARDGKAHWKTHLEGNATTYSSSDSSSPLGKLTSSSSSAFLLREDMVILGSKWYQLGQDTVCEGDGGINLMCKWCYKSSRKEKKRGKGRADTRGMLDGCGEAGARMGARVPQAVWEKGGGEGTVCR